MIMQKASEPSIHFDGFYPGILMFHFETSMELDEKHLHPTTHIVNWRVLREKREEGLLWRKITIYRYDVSAYYAGFNGYVIDDERAVTIWGEVYEALNRWIRYEADA